MTMILHILLAFILLPHSTKGFGIARLKGIQRIRHSQVSSTLLHASDTLPKDENENRSTVQIHEETFIMKPKNDSNIMYRRPRFLPKRKKVTYANEDKISFQYKYNELVIPPASSTPSDLDPDSHNVKTRITLLIQPIGVGIGRWYYDRLLKEFQSENYQESDCQNIFLVPDLLGTGSASWMPSSGAEEPLDKIPLLTVNNWSEQLIDLILKYEKQLDGKVNMDEVEWCLISNGGCVPIALEVAKRYVENTNLFRGTLKNLILSATPRIGSLLKPQDVEKSQKSYRTLSGIAGKLFWWYALRNDGAFIQTFSEKNLASKAENLGSEWRPKCVETARDFNGLSKFSTFAFLAGSLNGGSQERLDALKDIDWLKVDVITGGDTRSNQAKSWFWDKKKEKNEESVETNEADEGNKEDQNPEITSLIPYLLENGNSGREIVVKGRRCPAHEDAPGFANAVSTLLNS